MKKGYEIENNLLGFNICDNCIIVDNGRQVYLVPAKRLKTNFKKTKHFMKNEETQNEALNKPEVSGSSSVKKFRRGKKFQKAYFEIGTTNQVIGSLMIEADIFEKNGNITEAESRQKLAEKLKLDLKTKYEKDNFDLDYYLSGISGTYNKLSIRDVL